MYMFLVACMYGKYDLLKKIKKKKNYLTTAVFSFTYTTCHSALQYTGKLHNVYNLSIVTDEVGNYELMLLSNAETNGSLE